MFKLGSPPVDTTTTTATTTPANLKMKKPEQEPMITRNNLQQTYVSIDILK
jgi:hypothetical protein